MSARVSSTAKEINKIFSEAVRKAQARNRRKGIQNVFSRGGRVTREALDNRSKVVR